MDYSWLAKLAPNVGWSDIRNWWEKAESLLGGRPIAVTGMGGVGKTVLFDALSGKARNPNWNAPTTPSPGIETARNQGWRKWVRATVIPGQNSPNRSDALRNLFIDGKVQGVVHVVANGFAQIRESTARDALILSGCNTVEKLRQLQLEAELKDLEQTCEAIRNGIAKHRKPRWMLVAVTKVDLYHDAMQTAQAYYSPHGQSPFVAKLNELMLDVGRLHFRWDSQPACPILEEFKWDKTVLKPMIATQEQNDLLLNFAARLKEFCDSTQ